MTRNYTEAERALLLLGVAAGASLEEINRLLEKDQKKKNSPTRLMPKSSYDMVKDVYGVAQWTPQQLWEQVLTPRSVSDL